MHRTTQTLLLAGLLAWSMLGALVWVLRDGLGPNAIESHGWEALARQFWTFYWGPVLLVLVVLLVLLRRKTSRGLEDQQSR
jgi:cytochrome c oxidase subunit IV